MTATAAIFEDKTGPGFAGVLLPLVVLLIPEQEGRP